MTVPTVAREFQLHRQQKEALAEVLACFIQANGFAEAASGVVGAIKCLFPTKEAATEAIQQVMQMASSMDTQGVQRGRKRLYY